MTDRTDKASAEPSGGPEREPYVPPEIRRIQLSVDEALMAVCKSGLGGGPLGPECNCMGGGS